MAILAPVILAAKSTAVASAVSSVSDGIAGLVGDTATDKQRQARARQLTQAALSGDLAALRQLAYDAFEQRRGLPGDARAPVDGKRSPPDVRDLGRKGLQQYVRQFGGLPQELAQYAPQLGADVIERPDPILKQLLQPAVNTVTDAALERAAERSQAAARQYIPYAIAGAVALGVIVYLISRRAK